MTKDNYYISFVLATRNDDHGSNMQEKNRFFVERWSYLAEKYNLSAELIIVEWNPNQSRKKLSEVIEIPKLNKNLSIRIIEVEKKYHEKFTSSKKLDFFQMQAKNVGVRRAKGEFIVCTNIDVIFSENLFQFLSEKKLKSNTVYRTDRYDLNFYLYEDTKIEEKKLMQYLTLINKQDYTINVITGEKYYINRPLYLMIYDIIKFLIWVFPKKLIKNIPNLFKGRFSLRYFISERYKLITKFIIILNDYFLHIFSNLFTKKIHTNACGDFTLMHKDIWYKCSAYYEYDGYSFHIDSILLYKALYKNYNFINLKEKIFHINHTSGSGFQFQNNELFERLDRNEIPYIDSLKYLKFKSLLKKKSTSLNNDNWGIKGENLKKNIYIKSNS